MAAADPEVQANGIDAGAVEGVKSDVRENVKTAFQRWDTAQNGHVSFEEMSAVLQSLGLRDGHEAAFAAADVNNDGKIDYKEFIDWVFDEASSDESVSSDSSDGRPGRDDAQKARRKAAQQKMKADKKAVKHTYKQERKEESEKLDDPFDVGHHVKLSDDGRADAALTEKGLSETSCGEVVKKSVSDQERMTYDVKWDNEETIAVDNFKLKSDKRYKKHGALYDPFEIGYHVKLSDDGRKDASLSDKGLTKFSAGVIKAKTIQDVVQVYEVQWDTGGESISVANFNLKSNKQYEVDGLLWDPFDDGADVRLNKKGCKDSTLEARGLNRASVGKVSKKLIDGSGRQAYEVTWANGETIEVPNYKLRSEASRDEDSD